MRRICIFFLTGALMAGMRAPAQTSPLPHEYRLLASRGNMEKWPDSLRRACDQMRYDFRIEFARQRELRERIFSLLENASAHGEEIHRLTAELKEIVSRIRQLGRPEWHREIWPLRLRWHIHRNELFDESADVEERVRIRNLPAAARTAEDLRKMREPPLLRTDGLEVDGSYFLGEAHAGVRAYLEDNAAADPRWLIGVRYEKNATALELCQFLPSLQFAVTVRYRIRPLGFYIEQEKRFYLTYGDPLPGRNALVKFKEGLWPEYSLLSL